MTTVNQLPEEREAEPPESSAPQYAPYPSVPRNGLGWSSLILGIVATVLALVYVGFGALVAIPAGIVGLVLGISNRGRLQRGTATNPVSTIIGCVLSALGILLGILVLLVFWAIAREMSV